MTAGLPGLGISGIFYLCLVLIMPIQELMRLANGTSNAERWKTVGFQWCLASLMMLAVQAEFFVVHKGIRWLAATDTSFGDWLSTKISYKPVVPQIILGTSITLGLLLMVCLVTHLAYRAQKAGRIRQMVGEPAAHRD